jgi:hypothetical protein
MNVTKYEIEIFRTLDEVDFLEVLKDNWVDNFSKIDLKKSL